MQMNRTTLGRVFRKQRLVTEQMALEEEAIPKIVISERGYRRAYK
jgi:hypothetical protein